MCTAPGLGPLFSMLVALPKTLDSAFSAAGSCLRGVVEVVPPTGTRLGCMNRCINPTTPAAFRLGFPFPMLMTLPKTLDNVRIAFAFMLVPKLKTRSLTRFPRFIPLPVTSAWVWELLQACGTLFGSP
jgi:hypothetical protein